MLIEAILACLAAGLVVGVAWRLITPEIVVEVTANGTRLPPLQAGKLFSVEAWFAILGAGAGVVLAIVLFMRHRHQPAAALAGAVAGGSLGALVAWRLGVLLGPGPLGSQLAAAAEGDLVPVPRDIDAYGVLLVWPIASTVVMIVLTAVAGDHAPRHSRRNSPDELSPPG